MFYNKFLCCDWSALLFDAEFYELSEQYCCYFAAPEATMQTFPPGNGGGSRPGYQSLGSSSGMFISCWF